MARHKVLSTGYTFTNGSRTITITDSKFAGFNRGNIRLIINETQNKVICSSMQKANVTVSGSNITFSSSLPVLATGDELTIEMDMGFVGADTLAVEVTAGKVSVAAALTTKGQASTSADSFDLMASKILAVTGNVTVTPVDVPSVWHDLAYEIAQWNDVTVPYRFAVLLPQGTNQVALQYGYKFKVSDGTIYSSTQSLVTIGGNESGRSGKLTKYIIFGFQTPVATLDFSSYPYISMAKKILMSYNYGMDISGIKFDGSYAGRLVNDSSLQYPLTYNSIRNKLTFTQYQYRNALNGLFIFPSFTGDATALERSIVFSDSMFYYSGITDIIFPNNIYSLTILGFQVFAGCNFMKVLRIPSSLNDFTVGGSQVFNSSWVILYIEDGVKNLNITSMTFYQSLMTYLYIGVPATSFSATFANSPNTLTWIELGAGWNFTIDLSGNAYLTAANNYPYICQKLVDYRADGTNTPTITADGTTTITGTNTQFTKVHHVGETIYVNAVSKVISTITDDNHMVMTTTVASGTNVSYGMNKVLTLASANKTALTAAYPTWQTDLQAKGWTIA